MNDALKELVLPFGNNPVWESARGINTLVDYHNAILNAWWTYLKEQSTALVIEASRGLEEGKYEKIHKCLEELNINTDSTPWGETMEKLYINTEFNPLLYWFMWPSPIDEDEFNYPLNSDGNVVCNAFLEFLSINS